ncbi:MAG: pilus assembly protein PilP [Bdellovibrionota bacterium]|nr:MAG: pilus assembly protein PilP [Bdellovibrionota bacterium]
MTKKKKAPVKKIVAVLAVLIALQVVFIIVFGSEERAASTAEVIKKNIDKQLGGQPRDKQIFASIQAALIDHRDKHGRYPKDLKQLIPTYFDSVPLAPSGQEFEYRVEGGKYILRDPAAPVVTTAKAGEAAGTGAASGAVGQTEASAILAALEASKQEEPWVYESAGKRDPFVPFRLGGRQIREDATPLERYPYEELRLAAVLAGIDTPTAIVENPAGKGYRVTKGTKIGLNGGEVVEILPDKILILETEVDFTGEKKTRTIEMVLRTTPPSE